MRNRYIPGQWNALCGVCGFKLKSAELVRRWDGAMVCEKDWEARHPSDLIRPVEENPSVPWSRPEPADTFRVVNYITPAP